MERDHGIATALLQFPWSDSSGRCWITGFAITAFDSPDMGVDGFNVMSLFLSPAKLGIPPKMQIVRNDHSWRIEDGSQTLHESLESLARQSGYRVADLSRHVGITEQHLRRLFHRDVGIPIKEWLRCERMMIARRMLNCGFDPSEISNSLGNIKLPRIHPSEQLQPRIQNDLRNDGFRLSQNPPAQVRAMDGDEAALVSHCRFALMRRPHLSTRTPKLQGWNIRI